MQNENTWRRLARPDVLHGAAVFALAAIVVFFSVEFSRGVNGVAAIWPVNAIVLAYLSRRPQQTWPLLIGIGCAANVVVSTWLGDDLLRALLLTLANATEIGICCWLLFLDGRRLDLSRPRGLLRFMLVAGVGAPLASALIATIAIGGPDWSDTFLRWFMADGLGMLTFAPAMLVLDRPAPGEFGEKPLANIVSAAVVLLIALVVVFCQRSYPLLFCVPPALMYVTFRLGTKGAAAAILITAVWAIGFTLAGYGPVQLVSGDETARVFTLEAFLAFISVSTLPVAAALAEGRRAMTAMQSSNAELLLARREADAARAEAARTAKRYKELTDNSSDIVVRFGPGGIISHVSPSIRMLGFTPEQAVGRSTNDFAAPENREHAVAITDALFAGPEPDPTVRREFLVRKPDGTEMWLEGSPTIIRDEDGDPVEVVSVFRDVTRRHELEENLNEARRHAEEAAQARLDFLAQMSHEIRTPLNSIVGFSRLLRDAQQFRVRERRFVDIVASSGEKLLALVSDVLDLSKMEAGAFELTPEPTSIASLVQNAIEEVRILADAKGLALTFAIEGPLAPYHLCDEVRLRQVLYNLLNNAIKFTATGGVAVTVAALGEAEQGRQTVRIAVVDTGIGIPKEFHDRLFARFTQADSTVSRRFGGTGLGLAIVKQLGTAMGGTVGVQSREGEGSTFWFEAPLTVAKAPAKKETPPPAPLESGAKRILIVDDVDLNRELAAALLNGPGASVDFAANGADAVRMVERNAYDIVFMDVQMDEMDGLAATRAIRLLPDRHDLPIIAMTAQALPQQIAACRAAGMNDYVPKPLAPDALHVMVAKWVKSLGPAIKADDDAEARVFAQLRPRFIAACRNDLEKLYAIANGAEALDESAHALIHRLAGAGVFGFPELGNLAKSLDIKVASGGALIQEDLRPLISALAELTAA